MEQQPLSTLVLHTTANFFTDFHQKLSQLETELVSEFLEHHNNQLNKTQSNKTEDDETNPLGVVQRLRLLKDTLERLQSLSNDLQTLEHVLNNQIILYIDI